MLLAVEGGGFFSSSASGYSKGLTLLLLGQRNEEKPMRVAPWNQYQLVDQEADPDLPLASGKNLFVCGCASFDCLGRTTAGLENPSLLEVGPTQRQEALPKSPISGKSRDQIHCTDFADDKNTTKVAFKSNLKKPPGSIPAATAGSDEHEALCGKDSDNGGHTARRKVKWTDTSGGTLVDVREFEPSEDGGSDDEFDNRNGKTCSCLIM